MVLDYNVFEWDDKLYQQKFGTAIGTSCAPPYSGIYMEEVTDKAFREWNNLYPNPEQQLNNWARLIDDGFGTWQGSTNLLN